MSEPVSVSLGICSVTLRNLDIETVVRRAVTAGLSCIEWGADIHVPPGDERALSRATGACAEAGLRIASYGSYFAAGIDPSGDFDAILQTAVRLGAPRIRIWAGSVGSATEDPAIWERVVHATRAVAVRARDLGVELAFEFHSGTLADTADSTVRLLDDIDAENVRTYWQPPVGVADEPTLRGLDRLLSHVVAVHVFSWWPETERRSLAARESLWRSVFTMLRSVSRPVDALIEFLPDDAASQLVSEARTMRLFSGS